MLCERDVQPIFIFSLPRSGSTLLQRMLAAHTEVESVAEPWILLPFLYPLREGGACAEYSHFSAHMALMDVIDELPSGKKDYFEAVNSAVSMLYRKLQKKEARYFLDKTPRYALICEEITEVFPDAKFIFLWRNPLSTIASMVMMSEKKVWNIAGYKADLYDGVSCMDKVLLELGDRALSVNYELLCLRPEAELNRIFQYLDLEVEGGSLEGFSDVEFSGRMGDPTGVKDYASVSKQALEKWKLTINTPYRIWWSREYLTWLGEQRLSRMGYEKNQLMSELDLVPVRWWEIVQDLFYALYGVIYSVINLRILKSKLLLLFNLKKLRKFD